MHVTRETLDSLLEPSAFEWLAGIEDTFITAPSARTGRTLDEYELTGHYDRVEEDLGLFAGLGLRAVRYGIPWHRINPTRRPERSPSAASSSLSSHRPPTRRTSWPRRAS